MHDVCNLVNECSFAKTFFRFKFLSNDIRIFEQSFQHHFCPLLLPSQVFVLLRFLTIHRVDTSHLSRHKGTVVPVYGSGHCQIPGVESSNIAEEDENSSF